AETSKTYVEIEGTTAAHTGGTLNDVFLNIDPEIGNASGGTITTDLFKIDAITGDAEVTLNAINIGALTATGATETAIKIGANWDSMIVANAADLSEAELEILDGATTTTVQLNYLNAATGTTGTTNTNVVFSTSPTLVTPTLGAASATSLTTTGGIELGHASDTTIARSGAGAITVEGVAVSLLGATIGAAEVDADVATQAELDAVAALVDTDDEIIAIINASPSTQISVAAGGTGADLTDPNADNLIGWDDTDGDVRYITIGAGLTYTAATDTLSAAGAATAWDDLTVPDANETLDMTGYTTQWDFGDVDADMFTIFGTEAFGDFSIVRIEQKTGDPTDGDLLSLVTADAEAHVDNLVMANGTDDYVTHRIVEAGTYTIDVTSDGTAAVAIQDPTTFAETVSLGDDDQLIFGAASDWNINFDDSVDDQLLISTTNTAAIAITDPMFEILVGTTPTADQQVFGVAKGTQASNTPLMTLDEDGDVTFAGAITTAASNDPLWKFDEDDETDIWFGVDSSGNSIELRTNASVGSGVLAEFYETGDLVVTGTISGKMETLSDATATTYNVSDAQASAGTFFITTYAGTKTFVLPAAEAGMHVCVKQGQGVAQILRIDTDGTDYIVMSDGTRTSAAGDYYGATSSNSNQVCVVAFDATDWYVTSEVGAWTEE
ncbi:MAG: hypothetical protein ACXABF_17035, partial [Candidatus Thorarchaeota archaeon]